MTTTRVTLHVPLIADRRNPLMMSSPSSELMTSPSSSPVLASLDPVLVDFWSDFPCPPPWNEGLLFRVNWSSCVSQAVGERIRWFLADRCHINHNGTAPITSDPLVPGGGGEEGGGFGDFEEDNGSEVCDMSCKILVGIFCILFVIGVMVGGAFLLYRRRSQRKDQRTGTQQTTGAGGGERGRAQYAGIHYASASVIAREGERPLPPCPEGEVALPRQLHSYVYNPRDGDHPTNGDPPFHLCPMNRRAAYRAMEPREGSPNGDEPPHVYDYISDTESLPRSNNGHEYTYCTCDNSEGGSSVAAEYNSSTPRQSEGYYSDHDHVKQHEVSKPYPRYPSSDKAPPVVVVPEGGRREMKPMVVGGPGLNNNHRHHPSHQHHPPHQHLPHAHSHQNFDPALGFPNEADGDRRMAAGLGNRGVICLPPPERSRLIGDQPIESRLPASLPQDSGKQASMPWDENPKAHLPPHRANSYEIPVPRDAPRSLQGGGGDFAARVGGSDDNRQGVGGTLKFVNAPSEDTSTDSQMMQKENYPDEYPQRPVMDVTTHRANALAMHPRYFADYFDANSSSV